MSDSTDAALGPTIVLVHGAWADASTWSEVIPRLRRDDFTVVAVPNPLRGVASDSEYLAAYLQTIGGPIVLVGHSYGGFVITNAAVGNDAVKALVYVDAFAPDEGESIASLTGAVPGSELAGDPPALFTFVPIPNGGGNVDLYVQAPVFEHAFGNHISPSDIRTMAATQRPLAASTIEEPSGPPAWKTIPSWAIVGTEDRVIPPHGQEFMAERAGSTVTKVKAGHLSPLTQSKAIARVVDEAARSATPVLV